MRKETSDSLVLLWFDTIGFTGYKVGPSMHVADKWALADPLLARIPMAYHPEWRIGHFTRYVPDGYIQTLRSGKNELKDEQLGEYWEHLSMITREPIWSWERFKTIAKMNLRQYDHLINKEFYAWPSEVWVKAKDFNEPKEKGSVFDAPGNIFILKDRPLTVDFEGKKKNR